MKNWIYLVGLLIICLLTSCAKDEHDISACIYEKCIAFRTDPRAEAIVQVNSPSGPLYWFKRKYDSADPVYDAQCNIVCGIPDCECIIDGSCDDDFFEYPREVLWEN